LCREWKVPFYTYSAQELSLVSGDFTVSPFVKATTGVDNVCERAAIKAGGEKLTVKKTCRDGITIAIAMKKWRFI
jgi:cobalt-precorrin 5A hydrolase